MIQTKGAQLMIKRLKTLSGLTAALAVLALGGSAIASAARHAVKPSHHAKTTSPDTDSIQAGDQTSPDTNGVNASEASEEGTPSDGPGGHEDPEGDVENQE
jgi:hypothetical protein